MAAEPFRLLAVVSFLNEDRYLPRLLESFAAQTRPPDRLLLVDDGSADRSVELAEAFAAEHGWATALRRPKRPPSRDRLAGVPELHSFEWAVAQAAEPWEVVAKLDADLVLTPRTIETVMGALRDDPGLGMAGAPLSEAIGDGEPVRKHARPEHVEGATKFYRRECWEQISPLPDFLGWDMIDEVRAQVAGWRTATIPIPDGDTLHLRPMGSQDGMLRAFRRWGLGAWSSGEAPLHVVLYGIRQMADRPYVLGGAAYIWGWASGPVKRVPRAEPAVRERFREDQMRRIRAKLRL
jgi:biofilm PGA synthesis N-glycosyltransferase PgaC